MPAKKSKAKMVAMGNVANVTKEPDTKHRVITIPRDLKTALSRFPTLGSLFSSLPYSHEREYVDWIAQAKRAEARKARIRKTLKMLAEEKPRG